MTNFEELTFVGENEEEINRLNEAQATIYVFYMLEWVEAKLLNEIIYADGKKFKARVLMNKAELFLEPWRILSQEGYVKYLLSGGDNTPFMQKERKNRKRAIMKNFAGLTLK